MKIDQSFILGILNNPQDINILKAILAIGQAFNVGVIAEGVETERHRELLLELGCDNGQGFVLGKPMPGDIWYATCVDAGDTVPIMSR